MCFEGLKLKTFWLSGNQVVGIRIRGYQINTTPAYKFLCYSANRCVARV